jgi:fatty-acyl-CoA synthase
MTSQLNAWRLLDHAHTSFAEVEVVSRLPDGPIHRSTYSDFDRRARQLMNGLGALGLVQGDRVATLAWNSFRHLEAYFAIPCSGRVLHTLNLRLAPDDLAYMIGHADDRAILVDHDLLPILEQIIDRVPRLEWVVVLGGKVSDSTVEGAISYEELIASMPDEYGPVDIPEDSPYGICYTSGTTGRPKGVQYTHRQVYLHALAVSSAAGMAIGPSDCVLAQVPMFHVNAWTMPQTSVAVGAKQVFFAGPLDPGAFVDLLVEEQVTISAGVPTVWLAVADELGRRGVTLSHMRHIIVGGSRPPDSLIARYRKEFGVCMVQAWGMTETLSLAAVAWPLATMRDWDEATLDAEVRGQAGLPIPGIEFRLRDENGAQVPYDGQTMGILHVRGPTVLTSYLYGEGVESFTEDGWFNTGDVAVATRHGYFAVVDRAKDLIKSGGEWISSVDLEAAIMSMSDVAEAAVIAIPDEKWQERPLAYIVARPGRTVTYESVRAHLEGVGIPRWQIPDRIEKIDAIPRTGVGKFDKKVLRRLLDQ